MLDGENLRTPLEWINIVDGHLMSLFISVLDLTILKAVEIVLVL
ncbi:uncharacterized protein METZ01_LOCUS379955 [marine metagenome]|uniref:Uncharacterized protein n=1 Tax=marine metagenome TaxID=408172 RepID=A0A382U030_9ZZZZ